MTTVIVAGEEAGEPAAEVAEAEATETAAEATETVAEAVVEVAEIEAARDVELAEIAAESRQTEAEIFRDDRLAQVEGELTQCRTLIADLEAQNTELKATLLTLRPLTEEPPPETSLAEEESVEVTPVSQEGPAEEPVRKEPHFRWI